MINHKIIEELSNFTDEISDCIYQSLKSRSFILQEDDAWLTDELKSRIDLPRPVTQFFGLTFEMPDSLLDVNEEVCDVSVTVALFESCDSFSISADNVPLDGSGVGMHINIFFSEEEDLESDFSSDRVMLELENSVRHELEHILQEDYSSVLDYLAYHKIDFKGCVNPSNLCLYLVQPSEVSAHVRGYEHISNTRSDFFEHILSLLKGYTSAGHLTDDEGLRVFLCWKDWFERNTYIEEKGVELCAK